MKNTYAELLILPKALIFLALAVCCAFGGSSVGKPSDKKNVLLVLSFSEKVKWTKDAADGFRSALPSDKYDISVMELDVFKNKNLSTTKKDAERLKSKLEGKYYDAVVVLDTPAIDMVRKNFELFPENTNFVLAGYVDSFDESFIILPNVYGIQKRLSIKDNILLALRLYPDTKVLSVLVGANIESDAIHSNAESLIKKAKASNEQFAETTKDVKIEFLSGKTLSSKDMLKRLSGNAQNKGVAIFASWSSSKEADKEASASEISMAADGKIFTVLDGFKDHCIGGYTVDELEFGVFVAMHTEKIIEKGMDQRFLKFNLPSILSINIDAFQKEGLAFSRLPGNVSFYRSESGAYKSDSPSKFPTAIAGFAVLFAAVSGGAFFYARSKRRTIPTASPKRFAASAKHEETPKRPALNFIRRKSSKSEEIEISSEVEERLQSESQSKNEMQMNGSGSSSTATLLKRRSSQKLSKDGNSMESIFAFATPKQRADISEQLSFLKSLPAHSRVVGECMHRSLLFDNFDDIVRDISPSLAETLNANGSFLYKYEELDGAFRMAYSDGIFANDPTLRNKALPSKIDKTLISDWMEIFSENKVATVDILKNGIPARFKDNALLKGVGAETEKPCMICGIFKDGLLWGFYAMVRLDEFKHFAEEDGRLLKSVAGVFGVALERCEQIDSMRESEKRQRELIESIQLPIAMFDPEKNIIDVNTAAVNLTGKSRSEIFGMPCHDVFCRGQLNNENCLLQKVLKTRLTSSTIIELDGKKHSATAMPIKDNSGEIVSVIENWVEISNPNEAERKLEMSIRTAQEIEKSQNPTSFLATMSHELRTPLSAVIGYSELSQDPELSHGERIHNLRNINYAAKTLLSLINNILDLSRLEANQTEICPEPLDLPKMLSEFHGVFKYSAKKKNINLFVKIPSDMPKLLMDSLRLKQILMNIIGNAIKFTDKGEVMVSAKHEKSDANKINLFIEVKDTGIGIDEKYLEKIFNPFEDDNTKRVRGRGAYEGTGLGLAIAKRLVEKMNGQVSVESRPNEGSTFKLHFKDIEVCNEIEGELLSESDDFDNPEFDKKFGGSFKVLLVDDVSLNLKVMSKMLNSMKIEVVEASSSRKALDILERLKPDLIITDLWMPEMDGEEFAKNVRKDASNKNIPIVVVTADVQVKDPDKVFDNILLKPVTIKDIRQMLAKTFKIR